MARETSSLFLTNEFAKLCNTTKDTLFHYDEIGLLKPKEVRSNGYRYYSIDQLYTFNVIHELKRVGCSLEEIRDYLSIDEAGFDQFIDERKQYLEGEIRRMERSIQFLNRARDMTNEALEAQMWIPEIVHRIDRYIIISPRNSEAKMLQRENAESMQAHFSMCEDVFGTESFPFGFIVLPETLASGEIFDAYIFSWFSGIPTDEDMEKAGFDPDAPSDYIQKGARLAVVPEGNYLSMYHFGGRNTIGYTYQKMFDYMEEHHYRMQGPSYELNLVNFLNAQVSKEFITKILIRIS